MDYIIKYTIKHIIEYTREQIKQLLVFFFILYSCSFIYLLVNSRHKAEYGIPK